MHFHNGVAPNWLYAIRARVYVFAKMGCCTTKGKQQASNRHMCVKFGKKDYNLIDAWNTNST
jgi:hypothetical protein